MSGRRRLLDRDGLVVLEDALDAEQIARLTTAVDRVWRKRGDGAALHLLGFVGLDESFVELVDHPAALPLVCEVLGCNVFVYHCHLDVHPPLERLPARRRGAGTKTAAGRTSSSLRQGRSSR